MIEKDLKEGLLEGKINIALVQIESPFYKELNYFLQKTDVKLFGWREIESRKKKIISILENIKKTIKDPREFPDIVVFPEYSVPSDILPQIKNFSKDYKIIIAGTDQVRDPQDESYRKNVCPVIIQDMGTFFIEKNSLNEDELGIVEEGVKENCTLELHWKTSGKEELCLQIFICLDFLYNNDMLDKDRKGCIVVPMCSKSMKEFVGHQYTEVHYGKFVLFCNTTTLDYKEPIMAGSSTVYGASKEKDEKDALISLDESLEGVILVRLDVEHPFFGKPTPLPSSKPVVFKKAYQITSDYELEPISIIRPTKTTAIINPELFLENLKMLRLIFIKSWKYTTLKNKIKHIRYPHFDSFGVLGDYDTVSISFLTAAEEQKLAKYFNLSVVGDKYFLQITQIHKFYGYPPQKLSKEVLEFLPGNTLMYEKLLSLSRDWNALYAENERKNLCEHQLILGDYESVDLRVKNLMRAFICLQLQEKGRKAANLFERKIIKEYLFSLDSVKSLYSVNVPESGFNCDYLVDIIDTPHSIFDILLKVHLMSDDYNIEIFSNTFVVVEQLSGGIFNSLPLWSFEEKIYELSIEDLIKRGEGEMIEFKSSLKYDYKKGYANIELESFIAKTISGFMNSNGGILLIGVSDKGELLGLDKDYTCIKKQNRDGFEIELNSIINSYLGKQFRKFVDIGFGDINGKTICKVVIKAYPKPVYLRKGKKEFYVRAGNSTEPLDVEQANEYINLHWEK